MDERAWLRPRSPCVYAWGVVTKFLTTADENGKFVQQTGYLPIRTSALTTDGVKAAYADAPSRKAGSDSLAFAFVASAVPAWDTCRTTIGTSFTDVLSGQQDTDSALAKMTADCNAALAQG